MLQFLVRHEQYNGLFCQDLLSWSSHLPAKTWGIPTCVWLTACVAVGLPCCFGACRCCRNTRSSTYCTGHSTELPLPLLPLLLPLLPAPSLCRCEAYCRSCLQSGE